MNVLVTGGAGYIGSHACLALADRGDKIVVLDNLVTGQRAFVPDAAKFVLGNAGDAQLVSRCLREHDVETVLHFAGSIVVPESIEHPMKYYDNNVVSSRALIDACIQSAVKYFVFSSTAAVYGAPTSIPVSEAANTFPINPYGRTKLIVEWMLEDATRDHSMRYAALRYFNVAGVEPTGRAGQSNTQVMHLIKRAAKVALGRVDHLDIYGTDYPTRDGSAVRDYVHICDLVDAHIVSLDYLHKGGSSAVLNCGNGTGSSVLEVVAAFERVTGRKLSVQHAPRRAGDPAAVVADPTRIKERLGWRPQFNRLDTIVLSALEWEARQNA